MPQGMELSVSVVSHGQMAMVMNLLQDLQTHCTKERFEVILTLNIAESQTLDVGHFGFPVQMIRNTQPKGFGANHNQAFAKASGKYFCVLNPDIRLDSDPFPPLLLALEQPKVAIVAPLVFSPNGEQEDSARDFPTPVAILRRLITGRHAAIYSEKGASYHPDWIGGMFMLMSGKTFAESGGFDERYFLYYEDVDFCGRLRLRGWQTMVCPDSKVIHEAQHSSHRSLKYFRWHLVSLFRFFTSSTFISLGIRGHL